MDARTYEAPATLAPFNVGPEVMHGSVPEKYTHLLLRPYFGVQSGSSATSGETFLYILVEWRHPKNFYCDELGIW